MESQRYEVTLSRSDYSVGLSQIIGQLAKRDNGRRKMLFARLGAYIVILTLIAFTFPRGATAVFTAVLLFWLAELAIQAVIKTQGIGISFEPEAHGRSTVEFSDDGIVELNTFRTRRWTWDALRRVHRPRGYVVLEFIGWDMTILPDRLWATAGDRDAFVAELMSRQPAFATSADDLSVDSAEARLKSVEPILIARLFLTVEMFQLAFDRAMELSGYPIGAAALPVLAAGVVGGAMGWWASGFAFRWLESRSPMLALKVAWGVTAVLAAIFALWFLRLI